MKIWNLTSGVLFAWIMDKKAIDLTMVSLMTTTTTIPRLGKQFVLKKLGWMLDQINLEGREGRKEIILRPSF